MSDVSSAPGRLSELAGPRLPFEIIGIGGANDSTGTSALIGDGKTFCSIPFAGRTEPEGGTIGFSTCGNLEGPRGGDGSGGAGSDSFRGPGCEPDGAGDIGDSGCAWSEIIAGVPLGSTRGTPLVGRPGGTTNSAGAVRSNGLGIPWLRAHASRKA